MGPTMDQPVTGAMLHSALFLSSRLAAAAATRAEHELYEMAGKALDQGREMPSAEEVLRVRELRRHAVALFNGMLANMKVSAQAIRPTQD